MYNMQKVQWVHCHELDSIAIMYHNLKKQSVLSEGFQDLYEWQNVCEKSLQQMLSSELLLFSLMF